MQSRLEHSIQTSKPTIIVPTDVEPNIPSPQYWGTETILAIAILIRAFALLIQTLTPLIKKQV
ncbi:MULTISPECIES: hypothetical protein [unclassified Tolypothrix]|uniref:hypothetical protein n=1 Tax=unclassified Tolypothrix TaxID=2649714 RepID=UPI0005EAA636|nr:MULTISPECIES: hypothetical protein [unclassified Tolypothrix]BAY95238.1 hypothetical protein NIES3275_72950 [Microchaete diplosiphon NIES-3275]EKE98141.1 hypothetical protein FDUTEX481_04289 [Tolypothrix sp. PCC 7601]MBE9086011.1 hypothetical protein [Tolypothrix sp. LEGE 11397]UYD30467.1 hypothetical protein HGR01_37140 [Tolypothrix sp. PCC 7712]UYD38399.1 hypothetical protein HG267_37755 [Tolypothrix sp. PCC 7601]